MPFFTTDQRYNATATKHYGDLHEVPTANNITANRQIVVGPFGFGDAVQLDIKQQQVVEI